MRCKNNGHCVPTCDNPPEIGFFSCQCTEEWEGEICAVKVFTIILLIIYTLIPLLFAKYANSFDSFYVIKSYLLLHIV